MTRFATPLAILLLLPLAGGCVSAEGAFNDAVEAEAEGDLSRAFDRYHTALRRDDAYPGARDALAEVGAEIVAQSLAEASGAGPVRAADLYLGVETTHRRAAEVGVALDLPLAFGADLDRALRLAVENLRADAGAAHSAGAFSDALDALNRARGYRPSPEASAALDLDARDLYADWAEADLAAGRFRRALSSAENALSFSPPNSDVARELSALQAAILDAGSVRVAFFPAERMGGARGGDDGRRGPVGVEGAPDMPRPFLYDLDYILNDDHWRQPPLFVLSADPADVRRLLRRAPEADDLIAREYLLAGLARDLDADLGVAFAAGLWREGREEQSRDARRADMRRGGSATYDRVRTRLTLGATVDYAVVDARTRRVVCEGDVERDVRQTVTTHEYDGNWRELDLDRDDRRPFDQAVWIEAEEALYADLAESLAAGVAAEVYRCVGRLVP